MNLLIYTEQEQIHRQLTKGERKGKEALSPGCSSVHKASSHSGQLSEALTGSSEMFQVQVQLPEIV